MPCKRHIEKVSMMNLALMSLKETRWYNKLTFFYKIVNGLLPDYIMSYVEASFHENYPLRPISGGKLKAIPSQTKSFKKTCLD